MLCPAEEGGFTVHRNHRNASRTVRQQVDDRHAVSRELSEQAVRKTHSVCEAAICYTGDILDPKRDKYPLAYYVKMAKELERMGAHVLAIKDMAGLCRPYAAEKLVKALRQAVGIPIHF